MLETFTFLSNTGQLVQVQAENERQARFFAMRELWGEDKPCRRHPEMTIESHNGYGLLLI